MKTRHNHFNSVRKVVLSVALAITLASCHSGQQSEQNDSVLQQQITRPKSDFAKDINIWPTLELPVAKDSQIEQRIASILKGMSVEQKVAQLIQPEIRDITVEDMRRYGFGSYLNGGGSFPNNNKHATVQEWVELAESLYQASIDDSLDGSTIPTMWGTDAVHGHNNVIGATLFPHNIGLGAANNPALIEKIASITATEVMVTGIDWVFAPTVAVVRDDRWGRTYEGYSEDPEIVRSYSKAIVYGLQGRVDKDFLSDQRVISTVKHFVGDGGTENGIDQGNNTTSEQELFDIHAQGYVGGLTAGSQSVMASFNSWHGEKIHGNKYLLTDVLKNKMGFDGFVVGDWNGHGQIPGCSNTSCPQAINAGLDVFMVPSEYWKPLLENTIEQVQSGIISMQRLDDAVSRVLRVKLRAGLFDKPSPANRPLSAKGELVGAQAHRDVARQAVRESLVLLKNNNNILPLSPKQRILVAGDGAHNIGKQSGGWSVTWSGTGNKNSDFPGGTSIYSGIEDVVQRAGGQVELAVNGDFQQQPDVAIVVFGEEPYAEGNGDISNLEYQRGNKTDLALLKKLKAQGIPVVSVFISGRPLWVNPELNASDAFVAAWLPGTEGGGVSEVLFSQPNGDIHYDFVGKLSFSWPATAHQSNLNRHDREYNPLLPYGFGLHYGQVSTLSNNLDETVEQASQQLQSLVLFKRSASRPFEEVMASAGEYQDIVANVMTLGALTVKAVDKKVQGDARKLVFDGSEQASYLLASNFSNDLRDYAESHSQLQIAVNIEQQPQGPVFVGMHCKGNCDIQLDVSEALAQIASQGWQTLSIDLRCFTQQGLNAANVHTPFSLSSSEGLTLTLADITLVTTPTSPALLSCSK
ncbi:exo 1,3/1,4-beta-D-glucan glucohydrolase [Thalassotalea aquiviva]|uniref:glycoside hydrolase family 3 protein n=1 Tax=Thalassotalea aquiviva TaxID=3242415 RepID=UPI00352AEB86